MKLYYAAAGALLLGTSALAWAGDANKSPVDPVATTADKPVLVADTSTNVSKEGKLELAALDKSLEAAAAAETGAKLHMAALNDWTDADVKTASYGDASADAGKIETAWVDTDGDGKIDTAWVDPAGAGKLQIASVDKVDSTGMGGPLEAAPASGAVVQPSNANPELDARGIPVISDVAFVPPGYNGLGGAVGGPVEEGSDEAYPACTATVTDNCIQTYERGVDASLASSVSRSGPSESTAMGGPWQPVYTESELAMNGDGSVDVAKGETAETELASLETDTSIASHSDYQGVGGPVEAQSGYPPCSPGPGDDRCIQLYEPGVTGAGN